MIFFVIFVYILVGFRVLCSQESQSSFARKARNAIKGDEYKWNPSSIPYQIDDAIPNYNKQKIRQTLAYIEQDTCLRFNENGNGEPYIRYAHNTDECASLVGRQFNLTHQNVNLTVTCQERFDQILHETIHALGFYHEQCRSDRDTYMEVNEDILYKTNVAAGNWAKMETDNQGLPYDYASIMQYAPSEGTHSRIPVLTAKNNLSLLIDGMGLPTFQDILEVNKLYKCSGNCGPTEHTLACKNGGYPDPNNSNRCKCPPSFGGSLCNEFEPTDPKIANATKLKCGGRIVQANSDWITFKGKFDIPNKASPLFVPTSCWWWIKAPEGKQVVLKVQSMQKWDSTDCNDWDRKEMNMELKTNNFWKTGYRFECYKSVQNETFHSQDNIIVVGLYSNGYHNSFQILFKLSDDSSSPHTAGLQLQESTSKIRSLFIHE